MSTSVGVKPGRSLLSGGIFSLPAGVFERGGLFGFSMAVPWEVGVVGEAKVSVAAPPALPLEFFCPKGILAVVLFLRAGLVLVGVTSTFSILTVGGGAFWVAFPPGAAFWSVMEGASG